MRLLPLAFVFFKTANESVVKKHEEDRLIIRQVAPFKGALINSLKGPIYLLNIGLTLGLTILMAALSYRYFETPFLRMKKRHSVIRSQPV